MPDSGADAALLGGLEEISPSPPEPDYEKARSIPWLTAEKRTSYDLARFTTIIKALPRLDTQTLILKLETTEDPLALWSTHLLLDRRGIPPAQRWPANVGTPQAEYITALADLLWFAKRNPGHIPPYRGWRGVFAHQPAVEKWHAAAYRQYVFLISRSFAWLGSKGLGLSDTQRQDLIMFPTAAMAADRRALHPDKFADFRASLLIHAMQHPDKSRQRTPETIANRRARLWRVFVLSGHSQTATAKNWHLMTGEMLTRQAIAKQLAIISIASK